MLAASALHLGGRQVGVHQHLGAAVDRRQRVAQVVHDGTGQAADGRDALVPDQVLPRLLQGRAHRVERRGQTAEFVAAVDRHAIVVVLPRDFGGGPIQRFHRPHDAPRQQPGQPQADRHGDDPEQHDVAAQRVDALPRVFERPKDPQRADRLAAQVDQLAYQRDVLGDAVADQVDGARALAPGPTVPPWRDRSSVEAKTRSREKNTNSLAPVDSFSSCATRWLTV